MITDLSNELIILRIGEEACLRIHRKNAAPFKSVPVFWHEMKMQMAAAVSIRAIIHLVRMEGCVNRFGGPRNIREEGIPFLLREIHQFAHVILISHDAAPRDGSVP